MAIPLINIEDFDLLLSPRQVGEKYHCDHIRLFLKPRYWQSAVEPPHLTPESSSKIEKLKTLIESIPFYSKKDLKDKVLKLLELDELDDKEMESEAAPSQHNMEEDYDYDKEDDCYKICSPIRPKK
ncbi:unnamed protein product [Malus baccata var. baccata]